MTCAMNRMASPALKLGTPLASELVEPLYSSEPKFQPATGQLTTYLALRIRPSSGNDTYGKQEYRYDLDA